MTPEQVAAMYALYQQGCTLEQVGESFHYSGMAVSHIFRRYGLAIRKPAQTIALKRLPQTLHMYRDYQAGLSLREVGAKYGLSLWGVRHRFIHYGFQMRPTNGAPDNGYLFMAWQGR